MGLDPAILKQLIATFKEELEDQLQVITQGLLKLEKNPQEPTNSETILAIFRAAHNIKGASRSLSIMDLGEIAHRIETLFAGIQKKTITINAELISGCLAAVDKMKLAMQAFIDKKSINFDLPAFLATLDSLGKVQELQPERVMPPPEESIKVEENKVVESPVSPASESMRISSKKVETLAALLEELQVNKIAIDDHYLELIKLERAIKQFETIWKSAINSLKNKEKNDFNEEMRKIHLAGSDAFLEINNAIHHMHQNMRVNSNELGILTNLLQEEVRTLQLVPLSLLLFTMPRYVRDLSQELNKKVELKITGDEIKIDKMVLEKLKDPINHLIRNALDHGIESPEERVAAGKSAEGLINIDIREENQHIFLFLKDDGKGIDPQQIAQAAIAKKLLSSTEVESMSSQSILELIFLPGFSTKEIITNISGRGVGLDVVKSNLAILNGTISISSQPGKGTVFELKIPVSLTSEKGLEVKSGGQSFVIPSSYVQRVMGVFKEEIKIVSGVSTIFLNEEPLPLHYLSKLLNLDSKSLTELDHFNVVVLKRLDRQMAIIVDEIFGEREIVIKPLQPPFLKVRYVAGGTLAGSNQVMVVLNPLDLMQASAHSRIPIMVARSENVAPQVKHRILVVDDSITTRTLEKNILEAKNYHVTIAVNGKEAWDILQKQQFSLMITDVNMPFMDGFTLTDQVKKNEKLKSMPVIIVTSLGSEAEKKQGIDVGADAYIVKNEFQSLALLEIIEQLI